MLPLMYASLTQNKVRETYSQLKHTHQVFPFKNKGKNVKLKVKRWR